MNIVSSIINYYCPKCRKKKIFKEPLNISNPLDMNEVEKATIIGLLAEMIFEMAPDATLRAMYGGTVIELEKDVPKSRVGGMYAYADYVSLELAKGANFDDPRGVLEGKGKIDFKTSGELLGDIAVNDQDLRHKLERDYGTSRIPFRLEGLGYNLRSDYQFTLTEIGKSASKNLIKKETKKALDKNKDKLKKVLKGLFK